MVCEYGGLIHGWTYIWVGLYLESALSVSNMVGLCTGEGGLYSGAYIQGVLVVGGLRYLKIYRYKSDDCRSS